VTAHRARLARARTVLLPQPGPARTPVAANLTNSLGDGIFATASVVYFVRVVGLSPGQVTAGLAIGGVTTLLAGIPPESWPTGTGQSAYTVCCS